MTMAGSSGIRKRPSWRSPWRQRRQVLKDMSSKEKPSLTETLPADLLVEVTIALVSTSASPITDLKSLRRTCRILHCASMDRLVRQNLAFENDKGLRWRDEGQYRAFLCACADVGNIEANFILGMEEIYINGRDAAGLEYLNKAAKGGHCAAAYAMGITLLKDSSTELAGVEILDRLAVVDATSATGLGKKLICQCRRKVLSTLYEFWIGAVRLVARVKPCTTEACGRTTRSAVTAGVRWVDDDPTTGREFCASLCRWIFEYNALVRSL